MNTAAEEMRQLQHGNDKVTIEDSVVSGNAEKSVFMTHSTMWSVLPRMTLAKVSVSRPLKRKTYCLF